MTQISDIISATIGSPFTLLSVFFIIAVFQHIWAIQYIKCRMSNKRYPMLSDLDGEIVPPNADRRAFSKAIKDGHFETEHFPLHNNKQANHPEPVFNQHHQQQTYNPPTFYPPPQQQYQQTYHPQQHQPYPEQPPFVHQPVPQYPHAPPNQMYYNQQPQSYGSPGFQPQHYQQQQQHVQKPGRVRGKGQNGGPLVEEGTSDTVKSKVFIKKKGKTCQINQTNYC
jgi:hypothetical protein